MTRPTSLSLRSSIGPLLITSSFLIPGCGSTDLSLGSLGQSEGPGGSSSTPDGGDSGQPTNACTAGGGVCIDALAFPDGGYSCPSGDSPSSSSCGAGGGDCCIPTPTPGACTSLVPGGPNVLTVFSAGDPPDSGQGGSIVDGVYDLTESTIYKSSPTTQQSFDRETIRISGGGTLLEYVSQSTGITIVENLAPSGSSLNPTVSCPTGEGVSVGPNYTATADQFFVVNGLYVKAFTLRASEAGGGDGGGSTNACTAGGGVCVDMITSADGGNPCSPGETPSNASCGAGGSTCCTAAPGACTSLLPGSSEVLNVFSAGAPPPAQGGTIVDGTYDLTETTIYQTTPTTQQFFSQWTIRISGGGTLLESTNDSPNTLVETLAPSGSSLNPTVTCPTGQGESFGPNYTATPDQFYQVNGLYVNVFTLRE